MEGEFIANLVSNLERNGFPNKRVAFPLDKLYESAHSKGLNLNRILDFLESKEISHEKSDEKITFFKTVVEVEVESETETESSSTPFGDFSQLGDMMKNLNPDMLKSVAGPDMMKKALDFVNNMTPEQRENIMKVFSGMSPEQKSEMMKKAKDFGIKI